MSSICWFLQKPKQLNLLSASIANPGSTETRVVPGLLSHSVQQPEGPWAQLLRYPHAIARIGLLRPSSLTWLSPKNYFDLNILFLICQALPDPCLSLRQFQISVRTWKPPEEHLMDRRTLFFPCFKKEKKSELQ